MKVAGWHAVFARLERDPATVRRILLQSGRRDRRRRELEALCRSAGLPIAEVSRHQLDAAVGAVHQGVVAECDDEGGARREGELADLVEAAGEDALVVVLDGITDPRNLGACIRTADAAGACALVFPRRRSAPITEVARKAASGAAESLAWFAVTNLARTLRTLAECGLWIVGTDQNAALAWHQVDYRRPLALVLGSEGKGMRRLTREHCDELVRIPMSGAVDSLNVSVAAGVCLFEVCRQRLRE